MECAAAGYPVPKIMWLKRKGSLPKKRYQQVAGKTLVIFALYLTFGKEDYAIFLPSSRKLDATECPDWGCWFILMCGDQRRQAWSQFRCHFGYSWYVSYSNSSCFILKKSRMPAILIIWFLYFILFYFFNLTTEPIYIAELPEVTNPTGAISVREKSDVTVKCSITGSPKPAITWVHNGMLLRRRSSISIRCK